LWERRGLNHSPEEMILLKNHNKKTQKELQREKDILSLAIEAVGALIMVVDVTGKITFINKKGTQMLGYEREEIMGKNWIEHFAPERWASDGYEVFRKLQKGELPSHYIHPFLRKDGAQRILSCDTTILKGNKGHIIGLLCVAQNITQIKEMERKLRNLSHTDYLTGLYNTRYFYKKIKEEIQRSQRYKVPFSLLYIDIDNFKRCNDVHGHQTGDQVLQKFSKMLNSQLRNIDSAFRYGGEEFIVLLPHTGEKEAREVTERIRRKVEQHLFPLYGITLSIGVAQYQVGEDIVEQADRAMYRAKRQGKNKVCVFSENFHDPSPS